MLQVNSFKKNIPHCASPLMVSASFDETREQWRVRHAKYKSLPEDVQEIIASNETDYVIWQIAQRYKFDDGQARSVARSVRLYYFGELTADDFAGYLEKVIPVQQRVAESITQIIMRKIINNESLLPRETMTVKDALEKYEDLRNQMITTRDIIVTGTQSLARPTIGHWLTDYHLSIGQGEHSSIQRGNYLFHNKNSEQLSDIERQRLAIVLKSWDENIPLVVDVSKQKIIFPAQKSAVKTQVKAPVATQAPTQAQDVAPVIVPTPTSTPVKQSVVAPHQAKGDLGATGLPNEILTKSVMDKVAAKVQAVSAPSSTPRLDELIAAKKATLANPVEARNVAIVNPRDLRNQHLARAVVTDGTIHQPAPTKVQNVPTQLPVISAQSAEQSAQTGKKQPTGFVSFSSKQKLPTEER